MEKPHVFHGKKKHFFTEKIPFPTEKIPFPRKTPHFAKPLRKQILRKGGRCTRTAKTNSPSPSHRWIPPRNRTGLRTPAPFPPRYPVRSENAAACRRRALPSPHTTPALNDHRRPHGSGDRRPSPERKTRGAWPPTPRGIANRHRAAA